MMIGNLFYGDYQQLIADDGAEISVAEAHGIMTGILCVDQTANFEQFQRELRESGIDGRGLNGRALDCMSTLFDDIRQKFDEGGFEFEPCLPDDDYAFEERTRALSDWCQGFLLGLGHADVKISWPGQCKEIIGDLIAISDVDPDSEEEDEEESLMELTEYVRVGVELIRVELQALHDPRKVH